MEESRSAGCSTLTMVNHIIYTSFGHSSVYGHTGSSECEIEYTLFIYFLLGTPSVQTVKPFTSADLKQIALPDILCNFRIMIAENIPVNPLCYLYPNTPKDQAFGKYYSEKTGKLFM